DETDLWFKVMYRFQLKTRHLDNGIVHLFLRKRQVTIRHANIAAAEDLLAGLLQGLGNHGGGGGLTVGASDGDDRNVLAFPPGVLDLGKYRDTLLHRLLEGRVCGGNS